MNGKYRVNEIFYSLQGEGFWTGTPMVFVRLSGCNLQCPFCDTDHGRFTALSTDGILEAVRQEGGDCRRICLTGGEPLLQKDAGKLIERLLREGQNRVEIETNGSVDLGLFARDPECRPVFTMDYKLPSSGWEGAMNTANFEVLSKEDTVKFVAGSPRDLERAAQIIEQYGLLEKCHVYFSPVFGQIEPVQIVDFMIGRRMNEARIQIQMHKVIWDPNQRGV